MSLYTIVRRLSQVVLAIAFFLIANPASAQYGGTVSVYADMTWDGDYVYGWIDGYDNSWGCDHYDYSAFGQLSSPTRSISGDPYLTLPFANDEGSWEMAGGITFFCSCIYGYTGVSNSISLVVRRIPTFVRRFGSQGYTQGPPAPWIYIVNREILDQWQRPFEAVMFVNEIFDPNPPNASGGCTAGEVIEGDANSSEGGTFGPDFYFMPAGVPTTCSQNSLQRYVITYEGYPYTIFTTYNVTWAYSGLTLQPSQEP
jgi:hypothetical protein